MISAQNSYLLSSSATFNLTVRMPRLPSRAVRVHIEGVRNVSLQKATNIYLRSHFISDLVCELANQNATDALYVVGDECAAVMNETLGSIANSTQVMDGVVEKFAEVRSTLWTDAVPRTYGDARDLYLPATGSSAGMRKAKHCVQTPSCLT